MKPKKFLPAHPLPRFELERLGDFTFYSIFLHEKVGAAIDQGQHVFRLGRLSEAIRVKTLDR
jgi:hypothetical protein